MRHVSPTAPRCNALVLLIALSRSTGDDLVTRMTISAASAADTSDWHFTLKLSVIPISFMQPTEPSFMLSPAELLPALCEARSCVTSSVAS